MRHSHDLKLHLKGKNEARIACFSSGDSSLFWKGLVLETISRWQPCQHDRAANHRDDEVAGKVGCAWSKVDLQMEIMILRELAGFGT